jgi:hypothetical protein
MSFNGVGGGEDGSIPGASKLFEYEGPSRTKKKKILTTHILTLQSCFQFMCNVLHPKIIRFPQTVFIYFVSILKSDYLPIKH